MGDLLVTIDINKEISIMKLLGLSNKHISGTNYSIDLDYVVKFRYSGTSDLFNKEFVVTLDTYMSLNRNFGLNTKDFLVYVCDYHGNIISMFDNRIFDDTFIYFCNNKFVDERNYLVVDLLDKTKSKRFFHINKNDKIYCRYQNNEIVIFDNRSY